MGEREKFRMPEVQSLSLEEARRLHHRQAQLLAEGREVQEIAIACDTTPERINRLLADPTFQELIAFYRDKIQGEGRA
jgi:hypothetical protein